MELNDFIIKKASGKNTALDKQYKKLIENVISNTSEETEFRWEIYNLIIGELISLDNGNNFNEIKYRFTDNEDPNKVLLEMISRYSAYELSSLVWILKGKLEEFVEDDFFKRFY
jgi:hypothetical protein